MTKPHITIYQAISDLHNPDAVRMAHKEIFTALESHYQIELRHLNDVARAHGSAIIFVATGGVEQSVKEALAEASLSHLYLLADGMQNSLAASMEISAWLTTIHIPSRIIHGTVPYMISELQSIIAADRLRGCRVGLLGGASGWLISSDINLEAVGERYGLEFVGIELDEVVAEFHNVSAASMDDNIMSLRREEPSVHDIDKALRLTSALERIVERYKLDAFTIKCFDLLGPIATTGCLALAILSSKGIPAGCEGDIPALLTMLLSRRVAGVEAFMANPSRIESTNNHVVFAHCTLPLSMATTNILRSHFESGIGVALQGIIPEGNVTVVKWWGPTMDRYFLSSGRLIRNLDNPSMCRTQVEIELQHNVEYFFTRPLGNHHIILPGNHVDRLKSFFERWGVKP